MSTSKPILFFGTEDFSAGFLEMLIAENYDIRAVITKPDSKKGRGQVLSQPLVKKIAQTHSIAVWQPEKLSEIATDIEAISELAAVLVSYGKIIPQSIIDLFTPGIINVHPSLLPLYRGPSPVEATILEGDTATGVSIMQLKKAMDAGPVYTQTYFELNNTETQKSLYNALQLQGINELRRVLPAILSGELLPRAQDDNSATYCSLIKKNDAVINLSEPAKIIERKIRAFSTWPQARLKTPHMDLIVTSAEISDQMITSGTYKVYDNQLLVGTSTNALSIKMVKVPGKKEMPIQAFLSGYSSKLSV